MVDVGPASGFSAEMTTVELSQHTIRFEPPQRLLMLEITSEVNDLCLRVVPADAVEVNSLRLVSRTVATTTESLAGAESDSTLLMLRRLSEAFPRLAEIDVYNVPKEYRVTFGNVSSPFRFDSGGQYRISGVGEQVWETTAVAT